MHSDNQNSVVPESAQHHFRDDILRKIAFERVTSELTHNGRNALQRAQSNFDLLLLELQDRTDLLQNTSGLQQALDDINQMLQTVDQRIIAHTWH